MVRTITLRETSGIIIYNISEAAKIIYHLWTDPAEGKKKKKEFDQEIGLHETFLESVLSAYFITVIMVTAFRGES